MKKVLVNATWWLLFGAGITVCVGSGHALHGNAAHAATVGGLDRLPGFRKSGRPQGAGEVALNAAVKLRPRVRTS